VPWSPDGAPCASVCVLYFDAASATCIVSRHWNLKPLTIQCLYIDQLVSAYRPALS